MTTSIPYIEDEIGLFVESQGPFAPEILPDTAESCVFTRSWTGPDMIDVAAAPETIFDEDGESTGRYDVKVIIERRELGDEDGATSDLQHDYATDVAHTLEDAIKQARLYVENFDPEKA